MHNYGMIGQFKNKQAINILLPINRTNKMQWSQLECVVILNEHSKNKFLVRLPLLLGLKLGQHFGP